MSESAEGRIPTFSEHADTQGADLFIELERQLDQLLDRHREGRKAIAELQSSLAERERRMAVLEEKLAQSEALRGQVATRIDALISQIDSLEQAGAGEQRDRPEDSRAPSA